MLLDKITDCCEFTFAALDGVYGWITEAIAILIVVFVFNFLAKWILQRLHQHFEKQKKLWKISFVQALYEPLSYYIWFFAIVQTLDLISSRIYVPFPIENRHMLLSAGAVLALTWFLILWKREIVRRLISKSKRREITIDQGRIGAIDKALTVAIIFFTILFLLEVTDRSFNTLIAFGGIGGLALAFASQEIIANFFGSFMIYITQPFTVGDWIQLPDRSIEGHVEEIGWYMTRVRSMDKRPIYVPNSIFSKIVVITPSRMSHRQIKETLGVRYADISKVRAIIVDITKMLKDHPQIDDNQTIVVRLDTFGPYSVDIYMRAFTSITDLEGFMKIKEEVLFEVADIIAANGAELAFPTQFIELTNFPAKPEQPAKPQK